jgi:hypothetical protein
VDRVALGQFFSNYFGFRCLFPFHRLVHTHRGPSPGCDIIGQIVVDVPSGLGFSSSQETAKNNYPPCNPPSPIHTILSLLTLTLKNYIFIYIYPESCSSWPPLCSSDQFLAADPEAPGSIPRHYQISCAVVDLERGPLCPCEDKCGAT